MEADQLLEPCGHMPNQSPAQLHGVCVFCWRDRASALRARVAELERENAEHREAQASVFKALGGDPDRATWHARIEALKRENAALREAARPFAEHWGEWLKGRSDHVHPSTPGKPSWRNYLTVQAHIERLRAALAAQTKAGAT